MDCIYLDLRVVVNEINGAEKIIQRHYLSPNLKLIFPNVNYGYLMTERLIIALSVLHV